MLQVTGNASTFVKAFYTSLFLHLEVSLTPNLYPVQSHLESFDRADNRFV